MTPLAVTGVGVVSPAGVGFEPYAAVLSSFVDARETTFGRPPTVFDPTRIKDPRAAEVWDFDAKEHLGPKGLRNFDRLTTFLIVAARHALESAGIKRDGAFRAFDPTRVGVVSSTAYGSLDAITELNLVAELEDPRYINPARFPNTVINAAAGYVSIWEDLRAPNVTIVDGNCGALDAVLTAETHLLHHRADAFLVGGGEVLSDPLYLAFQKLGLMSTAGGAEALAARDGIELGEGAAFLAMERLADASARGADVLAEVHGYGTIYSAPESEAVLAHASAHAVERAVRAALDDAEVSPERVDGVVCAASGYRDLDAAEATGLDAVFAPEVPRIAPKGAIGETFGAAGAFGMAAALAWLRGGKIDGRALRGRSHHRRYAVVTTVGFYGNVSAVVLARSTT